MTENPIVDKDLEIFIENFPFLDEVRNKTFLITGVTGLIGSLFVKCMLKLNESMNAGISIVAIVRNKEKTHALFGDTPIQWIIQDMQTPLSLPFIPIDYIIHCASSTSSRYYVEKPVETINTTFLGTNNILRYACNYTVKSIVYLSSLESYGTISNDVLITEDMAGYINPIDVRSSYPLGKRMVECLCHSYFSEFNIPVKIARLTQTFGAGVSLEDTRVFAQFAQSIISGDDIILHTEGASAKPYCYTIDAILAVFYILLKGENGDVYNVANAGSYISIRDMASMLSDKFNSKCKVKMQTRNDMGYAPVTRLKLDTSKLEYLGWRPLFSLEDMFHHLIEYYKTKKQKI